ncbi:Undecaprenyl-phosphate galactose phosphotransferase [uncultured Sporomusa sp.]|uniref:Undecaprenyl-phosphate galactose phosphotransferase n=1 Tax=uncultured Sporomusa sp. TaxID=307249 RepID=A0A212M1J2_9FIRM|nr:undecaprenyl-phosphate galactose phosphotransferase WbaP [uncultured Sporomusa sp.]SCM83617.1 Undecaprenyl-phosphate galactose phosphotransferase [uncultured Sporomusa sp.]
MHGVKLQSPAWERPGRVEMVFDYIKRVVVPVLLFCGDYFATIAAVWTAAFIRNSVLPEVWFAQEFQDIPYLYTYVVIPMAVIFFMHFDRLYVRRLPLWQQTEKIFKVSCYAVLFILTLMYFNEAAKTLSRPFMVLLWLFTFTYLSIVRYVIKKLLIATNIWQIPVIIVGAGKTAQLLISAFAQDAGLGYKVVGLIEDQPKRAKIFSKIPFIGNFENAVDSIGQTGVQNVIIAAPGLKRERLVNLVYQLQPHVKNITFVPDLFGIPVGSLELETLFDEKAVLLKVRNNLARYYNRVLKQLFDILATLLGGFFAIPLLFVIALLIYFDSPGSVIFSHKRIGKNGVPFDCYKFRTMVCNAQEVLAAYLADNAAAKEEWERDFKLKNDPRVTRIGKFLRKTSLDELPQLINVLRGEMSLVGPRPIVKDEIDKYGEYIHDYYLVRPGLTGLWQVSGRNDIDYDSRVQMDSWYVRNWSVSLDIVMLLKTVKVVIKRDGAY